MLTDFLPYLHVFAGNPYKFFKQGHSCNLKIAQIKKNEKNMSKNYKLSRLFRNFVGRKKTYDISTKVL